LLIFTFLALNVAAAALPCVLCCHCEIHICICGKKSFWAF